MIHQIPFELRALDQWVIAGPDKIPINPRTGQAADISDPQTWGGFEEASRCGYPHVGFVLSVDDPYTIIDLDDPHYLSKDMLDPDPASVQQKTERHEKILAAFETYAELSQSGKGVHIICRGRIPRGVRRDRVEMYSDSRYMICTGIVLKPHPIVDCQELLDNMFATMATPPAPSVDLQDRPGTVDDETIFRMATVAVNGAKFSQLWRGEWIGGEWPSQSEADFALLSMLAFYTKDNGQVRRLFRLSALGQRDKATRNNVYIDRALGKIRAKELPAIDFDSLLKRSPLHATPSPNPPEPDKGSNDSPPEHDADPTPGDDPGEHPVVSEGASVVLPPGFVGDAARYILSAAIRPVPEIALAAAIALTAGVVGRAFNISGVGLNQYIILLARTGSGKEGAAKGIDALISAVRQQIPMADEFIGPSAFASGQALIRVLDKQPCFVSILGEFGLTLQQLCDPRANATQLMLKKVLLDLYAKSGFTSVLRSSVYSDTEKNTKVVQAPNVTILGESTPESFYDAMDTGAVAQGLIPRFSIFEYNGPRPVRNPHPFQLPPKELTDAFAYLVHTAIAAQQNRAHCPVLMDAAAAAHLDAFDERATDAINAGRSDIVNQLWNRAHLKALKLAALIAVGINPNAPCIDLVTAEWACGMIADEVERMLAHFKGGDVGTGDHRQEADLRRAVDAYPTLTTKQRLGYQVPKQLVGENAVIPIAFLRQRLLQCASFGKDRKGAVAAIKATITGLIEVGALIQMPAPEVYQRWKIHTSVYLRGDVYGARE